MFNTLPIPKNTVRNGRPSARSSRSIRDATGIGGSPWRFGKGGYPTNHKLVMKLLREEHLTCLLRLKKYRSYRGEIGRLAPNRLNRHFKAVRPNAKWATDITQFEVQGQKLCLSPILDLYNGEIVSYSLAKSPNFQLVMDMLRQAFQKYRTGVSCCSTQTRAGTTK